MSISQKLLLIIGVAVAGLLTLSGVWLHGEWTRILAAKQEKCRGLLEVPYSLVVKYQKLKADGRRATQLSELLAQFRFSSDGAADARLRRGKSEFREIADHSMESKDTIDVHA